MIEESYDKCPRCGRSLKGRVLIRFLDQASKEVDFICFSEESWNWIQKTAKKFGLNENQIILLFTELYVESMRIQKIGKKYKMYYNELTKMLNLFYG